MKYEHKKVVGIVYRPKELRKFGSFMHKLKLKVKRTFFGTILAGEYQTLFGKQPRKC